MASPHITADPIRFGPAFALILLGYVLTGLAAMPLVSPPGYAPLLYPAAGVALAALLVAGRRLWPAVAVGAFVVDAAYGLDQPGAAGGTSLLLVAAISAGAAAQAVVGARFVARLVRLPLTLTEPRDVLAFFAAGALSAAVGASATGLALYTLGGVEAAAALRDASAAWLGNTLGSVAAAPIVLTLFGRPREAWEPRRSTVGLTLALALSLLAIGILQIQRWGDQRVAASFERDASSAASALTAQLDEPLHALEALRGVFIASDDVSRSEMHMATLAWLDNRRLQSFVWMEPVPASGVAEFEARERAAGVGDFHVFDRGNAAAGNAGAPKMVVRFADSLGEPRRLLGVNAASLAETRTAIEAAVASGRPTASASFPLMSGSGGEPVYGIVVYQAIYRGPAQTVDERRRALRGVLGVSLRTDTQLAPALAEAAPYLGICAVDAEPTARQRRLAGLPGCEAAPPAELRLDRPFAFAGRQWAWRIGADAAAVPAPQRGDLPFTLVGLLATAMLGGFLLTVTGRANRIETAVRERTAALEGEVREREVAEAALRESEQRFRSILDNVPIGVVYSHLDGAAIQTNASMCQLTGYTEEELLRLHSDDYTHPEDVPQDTELREQLVRGEIPRFRRHKRFRSKTGAIVWVQATVTLLRDGDGAPRRVIAVMEDITEHLRLEEAEHAREVAESSNRAKSEFLSRMSHELRTPLNAMLGFAQLLELDQRHPLADTQQPWVRQIQQAGWHLLEMINDVLDLSRIESGNLRLQTEPLDITDLLTASLSLVEADARRRRVVITQDLEAGAATVLGDATRVKQVLTNLLTNAVKYNVEGGRIHIGSRVVAGEQIEIAVSDTGLGMTPDQTAQLFQPFNRLGRERMAQEGTGIGLVISQRLAELMGGSLRAQSVSGQGSSFILCLPRVADADTVRSALTELEATPAEYHRRVVHYVEDNETNVEVMRGILAQRPQVQMEVSVTGLDSLAAIRTRRPDLLLLDMHLPDISGLELLRHLKADTGTAGIPVVVVSADALAEQIETATQAGAAHYLTKPVSVAELLAVVDGLLERIETRYG